MKVRCLKQEHDGRILSVTPGETYEVLGIEAGDYRLINDFGDPVLFEAEAFEVVDDTRPNDWESSIEDGVEYAYPPEFNVVGFWEDYHEQKPEARRVYSRYVNSRLRTTGAA